MKKLYVLSVVYYDEEDNVKHGGPVGLYSDLEKANKDMSDIIRVENENEKTLWNNRRKFRVSLGSFEENSIYNGNEVFSYRNY